MGVGVIHVRARSYRDKHFLAVLGEGQRPCPVPASRRQVGDVFRSGTRLQVPVVIRKANHLVGIAHIQPPRIGTRRIKSQAIRLFQTARENGRLLGLPVAGQPAKNSNASRITLRKENVAVRGGAQSAGIVESRGIQLNFESGWRHRPRVFRPRHQVRTVVRRLRRIGLRQILYGDLVDRSWLLVAEIGERRRRRWRFELRGAHVGWRGRACLLRRIRGSHRLDVGHELPALLRRQGCPGGHPVVLVTPRDEPEHFTWLHGIEFAIHQRRHVARALAHPAMA